MRDRGAKFEIIYEDKDVVLIKDIGTWYIFLTVTNDAEEVVKRIVPMLKGRRLEYIDSEGQRDQLLIKDGEFDGFAPVGHIISSGNTGTR